MSDQCSLILFTTAANKTIRSIFSHLVEVYIDRSATPTCVEGEHTFSPPYLTKQHTPVRMCASHRL
ncbi:unnamed protein product, partial [Timema podura]|nr:unnamed protein product [Timema podura]